MQLFYKIKNGSECQKLNLIGIMSKYAYFLMLDFTDLVVDTKFVCSDSTEFHPQFLLIDKKSNQLISSAQTALVQHNQWNMSACPPVCFGSELGMCEYACMCCCVCVPGQQTNIVHHNYQFGVQLLFAAIINVRQFANALPSCFKALPPAPLCLPLISVSLASCTSLYSSPVALPDKLMTQPVADCLFAVM